MKALILDNEAPMRESLQGLLTLFCPEITDTAIAHDIPSGLTLIKYFQPDLLFLDVELDDGVTGFDLLRQVGDLSFPVIFVTAWDKYAIDAFRFSAIDFLLKPVDPETLQVCVQKAAKSHKNQQLKTQIDFLLARLSAAPDAAPKRIVLKDAEHIYYIRTADILYCEADGVYTKFFIDDNRTIIVSKNLKEYALMLEPIGFLRSHNSYLVNPTKIMRYDKATEELVLDSAHRVPLSHRKKEVVLRLLDGG